MSTNQSKPCECCGETFVIEKYYDPEEVPYCSSCIENARQYALMDIDDFIKEQPIAPHSNLNDWDNVDEEVNTFNEGNTL